MKKSSILNSVVASFLCVGMVLGFSTISKAEETVKLGCIVPMTGMFAGVGQLVSEGGLLAAKMINEQGGILGRKVEILIRDNEIRPAISVRMARELNKQQGVSLFFGICSSGVALALKPVMEEINSLLITCAAHSTLITGQQFSPNVFRITDDARTRNYGLAKIIHQNFPEVNKWANISPDYAYGHSCWDNFVEKMKELNPKFNIVADRWPKFGAGGSYGPHINAIMAAEPDGLYSVLYGGDMIAFIREAKQWALFNKVKVYTSSHMDLDVPHAVAKGMIEVWTAEHYCDQAYHYPLSKKYKEALITAHGEEYFSYAQGHSLASFDAVHAYKAAIEKAKSFEVADIRKALEDLTIDSPMGKKWIRAGDHQAYFDMPYYRIVPDPKVAIGWKKDHITVLDGKEFMIPVEEALKR